MKIIKSGNIELKGQVQLDIEQSSRYSLTNKNTANATPQARIVEKHPDFVVIEITCACGRKVAVRCDYTSASQPAAQESEQIQMGEEKNEN